MFGVAYVGSKDITPTSAGTDTVATAGEVAEADITEEEEVDIIVNLINIKTNTINSNIIRTVIFMVKTEMANGAPRLNHEGMMIHHTYRMEILNHLRLI